MFHVRGYEGNIRVREVRTTQGKQAISKFKRFITKRKLTKVQLIQVIGTKEKIIDQYVSPDHWGPDGF